MKKLFFPVAALLLASCNPSDKQTANSTPSGGQTDTVAETQQPAEPLQADGTSGATEQARPASFNGTLVIPPQNFATVTPIAGGRIRSLSLLPGSYVRQGTVLGTIENPDFIDLQQAYLDSRAQLEYLEAEYRRQQTLSQAEVSSQKKLQQSKADYLSMKSRLQASAAQLRLLGTDPDTLYLRGISPYMEVKAPINGYISHVQANLGKYLNGGEPLCSIIDKSRTMLRLTAYEKDLEGIRTGSSVQFHVNGLNHATFHARLISIGQQVDQTNRSIELYAEVSETSPLFRPGMYVSASIDKE